MAAEMIAAGGFQAVRTPLEPGVSGVYTKEYIRAMLGCDKALGAVVRDPDSGSRIGWLFFQPEGPAHESGLGANLAGGALIGRLLFGPVIFCDTSERVEF